MLTRLLLSTQSCNDNYSPPILADNLVAIAVAVAVAGSPTFPFAVGTQSQCFKIWDVVAKEGCVAGHTRSSPNCA